MTPHPDPEPLGSLARWLRDHPHDDVDVDGPVMSDDEMAALTEQAIHLGRAERARSRQRRRRRRFAVIAAAGVLATSGTVAALILTRDQPSKPHAGIACRATPDTAATAIVIEPAADAVGACRQLWDQGRFEPLGIPDAPDDLAACISPNGTIDVYPGPDDVCSQLGLSPADPRPDPTGSTLIELQERLITDINQIDCLTSSEAANAARVILDDLGLDQWPVSVNPDATTATCAKAAIGEDNRHIIIHQF